MPEFRFKKFTVVNERSAMKVNTDGVLLGVLTPLCGPRVLDIGTGTGTIALMLAQRLSEEAAAATESDAATTTAAPFHITGIDIDAPSVDEAAANFANSPWGAYMEARLCPLQEYIPETEIDLIVSNPPYYDDSLRNCDARTADARHTAALSYLQILDFAAAHLSADGKVCLVLPSEAEKALLRNARGRSIYPETLVRIRTTAGKPPKRLVASFSRHRKTLLESELTMMEEGRYTVQYTALLHSFYINL